MAYTPQGLAQSQGLLSDLITQSAPLRTTTANSLMAILGGAPASSLPMYAPNRQAIEGQYGQARNAIMGTLPRGGLLMNRLADLDLNRARAVSDLESTTRNQALQQALQIGWGAAPGYASGLTGSSVALENIQNARRQAQLASYGGLAQAGGLLLALLTQGGS